MNDFSIDSSYVILINDDNSMVTTRKRKIMQNSNLVDILCFLIHPDYAENDMENFSVSLHYYLPVSAIEVVEGLALSEDSYDGYLLYKLPIDTELTAESGDIHLSLTFSHKDIDENGDEVTRIRKVSGAKLRIEGSSPIKPVPDEYKRQVLFVNALPAIGDRECVYVYMDEFYLWNGSEYICTTDDSDDFPISGWEPNKQLITDENGNLALGDINGINISSSAKEGQTIIVKKTDEHGNPIEWECADTSIFGSKSEFVIQVDEPEDTSVLWLDLDDESDHAENIDLTGYATEKYVQNYAQPKGNYLTEHQDISGKLDTSALPTAIDSALAKAKESGEFDGRDGDPGQPGKDGQDYILTEVDKVEIAEMAARMVEVPESPGGIAVTGAKVGQTVKIAEVDENGVPTAWEAVEFPGNEEYESIDLFTVEEEGITTYEFNGTLKAFKLHIEVPATDVESVNGNLYVYKMDDTGKEMIAGYNYLSPVWGTVKRDHLAETYNRYGYSTTEFMSIGLNTEIGLRRSNLMRSAYATRIDNPYTRIWVNVSKGFLVGTKFELWGVRA